MIDSCRALKIFLEELVRDRHLKEFVDKEKTRVEKVEAKPNPRFDRGDDKAKRTVSDEEDIPLGTIHMIGGPHHPNLENRIWGKILMIKKMYKVFLVHAPSKKLRSAASEWGTSCSPKQP